MVRTHIYQLGILLILLIFVSCEKENIKKSTVQDYSFSEKIVVKNRELLKKRDSKYPLIIKKHNKKGLQLNKISSITNRGFTEQYMGRGYKINHLPIANIENTTYSIIDIPKLKKEYPNYFYKDKISKAEAHRFSYSDFSRYENNSSIKDKVDGGFSLDLGAFSIGAKTSFSKVFSTNSVNESKRIFGELNINVKDSLFRLQTSSFIKDRIRERYLDQTFIEELYNTPIKEVLDNYGDYILTGFYTGGKANVLYTGVYKKTENSNKKEQEMNNSITASYGLKNRGNASIQAGIGHTFGSYAFLSSNIDNLELSIKTLGGHSNNLSYSLPTSIQQTDIDLSQWAASLQDKSTHTIVDINNRGLIPIEDFLIEKNFQKENQEKNKTKTLVEPEIILYHTSESPNSSIWAFLMTRFGDHIFLKSFEQEGLSLDQKLKEITNSYSQSYKLKIEAYDIMEIMFAILYDIGYNIPKKGTPTNYLETPHFKKYINPNNGFIYLLNEKDGKWGFAIYDDFILDTYGIRDWVSQMPTTTVSTRELYHNYNIIGL